MLKLDRSNLLKEKARKIYPGLTGTFSRAATSFVEGAYPVYAQSANGAYFTDVDGNEFLDLVCSFGPISLGHNYPVVNKAIIEQLKSGMLFSLPHPVELELAEIISETVPHADMVKFEKSGSNAVTGAVRAARAITKRDKIAYCGSGGVWHDWQAAMVSRDGGVPDFNKKLIKIFNYNDSEGLGQIFEDNKNEIAAIVLEPTVFTKPEKEFLGRVRKFADENNALLILDEVVTGFRFDMGGGQKYFDIKGDMVCFGKSMGNGLPISAITGPTEFMNVFDKIWVSSTNNMEGLSLAGSLATITEMKEKNVVKHCWKVGKELLEGWNKITEKHNVDAKLEGYPVRMTLKCFDSKKSESLAMKSLLMQELLKKGVFMAPLGPVYLSYSHTVEDINSVLDKLDEVCVYIKNIVKDDNYESHLEGKLPEKIWDLKIPPTVKR
jgi:glutamate-1-semialdehyde aminotransferase